MLRRTWSFLIKEIIQLARMPVLVLFVIFGPLVEVSLIAWTTSAPIDDLPLAVVDRDSSAESRALLARLATTQTFDYQFFPPTTQAGHPLVESGQAIGILTIPAGFEKALQTPTGQTPIIGFVLDGADPVAAQAALATLEGQLATEGLRVAETWAGGNPVLLSLVQPRLRVRYNEALKKSVYTIPAELGLVLFAIGLMLAALGIARERELGTLEQLMVTPIQRFELIVAKAIPAVVLSFVSFLLMLAVSILFFGIPMRGSWVLLLGTSMLFLFVELSIGLMISAVATNQVQALLGAMMWVMTEFFFSGYGVPVENMPSLLQLVAHIFPIYHYMIIFRGILLKGVGLTVLYPQVLAGLLIGAVVIPVAIWFLGRQKWA